MKKQDRVTQIVEAAFAIAKEGDGGLHSITSPRVEKRIGASGSLIYHYVGHIEDLRNRVARLAIERKDQQILAMLIAGNHPVAAEIPADIRRNVVASMYR